MSRARFQIGDIRLARGAWLLVFALLAIRVPAQSNATTNTAPARTIGIEGHVTLDLPRADYSPRPLDDRTEFILRIDSITPVGKELFRYEIYYMGLEPGDYEVADFLVHQDGSRPDELAGHKLHVHSLLPEDHNGQLSHYVPAKFPFIGGYRAALGTVAVLWLGGIGAFIWSGRKRQAPVEIVAAPVEPSFAERLRPLVEAAAAGKLSLEDKARIERLLLGFWRDKLQFPNLRMGDAVSRLRQHAEAGELLRALERWLHQQTGTTAAEVNALLEPYRTAATPPPGDAISPAQPGRSDAPLKSHRAQLPS